MTTDGHPEIVCICGSTRFAREMQEADAELTIDGQARRSHRPDLRPPRQVVRRTPRGAPSAVASAP